jgi:hypothetical protein
MCIEAHVYNYYTLFRVCNGKITVHQFHCLDRSLELLIMCTCVEGEEGTGVCMLGLLAIHTLAV